MDNSNSDPLAKISLYKKFLTENNFPDHLPDYDNEAYWDARYEIEQQEVYEWYVDWKVLKNLFKEFVSPEMHILELGTGKSEIIDHMYK